MRKNHLFVNILRTAWPILLIFHQNVSNNIRDKYIYQFSHKFGYKRVIHALACPKTDQMTVQKLGFRLFLQIHSLDFFIFRMKLQGMVGHKMGLKAISRKFWFFHNGGILCVKITFSSISQEPFDLFCSFFIKVSQIISGISTPTSYHTNYPQKEAFMLRRVQK